MNPQVSPWMKLADRLILQSQRRDDEEKQLQKLVRSNYQRQLRNQMEQERSHKKRQIQESRELDKMLMEKAMKDQQKIFQIERLKTLASNEKELRLQLDAEAHQRQQKEKHHLIQQLERSQSDKRNADAMQLFHAERQQEERKKYEYRHSLKESIQEKQAHKKLLKEHQKEFENHARSQQQKINTKQQYERHYLFNQIKRKAATIDHSPHSAADRASNHQTLLQRKKSEWRTSTDSLQRQQRLRQFEKNERTRRSLLQQHYRDELASQIRYNEENRLLKRKIEVEADVIQSKKSQEFALSIQQQRKLTDHQKKKNLGQDLHQQIGEREMQRKLQPYGMRQKEYRLNLNFLQGSRSIIPGETYGLDYHRKKQLETVAKSMGQHVVPNSSRNYLADKGRNVFHQ